MTRKKYLLIWKCKCKRARILASAVYAFTSWYALRHIPDPRTCILRYEPRADPNSWYISGLQDAAPQYPVWRISFQ